MLFIEWAECLYRVMPLLSIPESHIHTESDKRHQERRSNSAYNGNNFLEWFDTDFLKLQSHPGNIPHSRGFNRRDVLKIFAAAPLALSALFGTNDLTASQIVQGRISERQQSTILPLIIVFLSGGASAKETFNPDPPGTLAELRGPMSSIQSRIPGVHLNETFPELASNLHRCALIRSLDTGSPDHTPSMATAVLSGNQTISERVGSRAANGSVPYVMLNPGSTWYGLRDAFRISHSFAPLWNRTGRRFERPQIGNNTEIEGRLRLLEALNTQGVRSDASDRMERFQQTAIDLLRGGGRFFDALDLPDADRSRYGGTDAGDRILMAKRFIDAGAGAVTVYEEPESVAWDRHSNIGPEYNRMNRPIDHAISVLMREFHGCILLMGEFNRTPRVNSRAGRDHWQFGNCAVLSGGRTRGGAVVGRTNPQGHITDGGVLQRQNLYNTIRAACGEELGPMDQKIREMIQ